MPGEAGLGGLGPGAHGQGATVWLTGLPSAGKTTVAREIARQLTALGRPVEVLDGDEVRPHLSQGLGYSRADRDVNVRRIGWVASRLAAHAVVAVAAVVSPYAGARAEVRRLHEDAGIPFVEVWVATPLARCRARDVKGLYARFARGGLAGMTGEDDPYEPPEAPDVVLGGGGSVADAAASVLAALDAQLDARLGRAGPAREPALAHG